MEYCPMENSGFLGEENYYSLPKQCCLWIYSLFKGPTIKKKKKKKMMMMMMMNFLFLFVPSVPTFGIISTPLHSFAAEFPHFVKRKRC